jgi:predicted aldo/keto reductase-like oxidoreductase
MVQRTLGKTGIRLPIVNMGVMNSSNPELVKRAYEMGMRHFDTAAWYQRGRNEEMVGKVIKDMKIREDVILGTKVYIPLHQRGMSAKDVKKEYLRIADESLARLQTEYVDILYSHSIDTLEWLKNPGVLEALQILKEQKKARFVGFTTHKNMVKCINEAVKDGFYEVIETAFNYAMSDDVPMIEALKLASAEGIGLVAMKTQCSQYWYRDMAPQNKQKFYKGNIMHTAVLKWVLRNEYITMAIPGFTTFEQLEDDFSVAVNLDYTEEEKKFLKDREIKLSMGYCRQCDRCVATCPSKVDLPALMRTHMYAACYANFYQARDTIQEIPKGRGLEACSSCRQCIARCANQVDIQQRINELKIIYG